MKTNSKKKKKVLIIVLSIVAFILIVFLAAVLYMALGKSGKKAPMAADIEHTGFYVDGTTLRSKDGEAFVMRGVNHAHCWYVNEDETALDAIAATGANTVRIVLACGIQWDADTEESIKNMIEAAKQREMVSIVEVHDGTGMDDIEVLRKITDFWIENAKALEGTESYCILNIANEWVGGLNEKLWKQGYCESIPKLREAGIRNTIMVDAAGWGQWGRSVKRYGYDVFDADPDKNTMFSIHMYGISGGTKTMIRYCLEGALEQNLCVCVGEFGYTHSDGDVKEDYLMQYCEEKNIGYLGWSWKGNSGGVEYLDIALEWDGSRLSADWGEKLINGKYGIKATSKKCSVFE